jgi:rhodanese-related sulfurtransferase
MAIAAVALALAAVAFVNLGSGGSASGTTGVASVAAIQTDTVVQWNAGTWTNVTPDRLAQMLTHKDFTLLNVKTPYIGEIAGTDLYIPYDQLTARATELPQNKDAKILVYCRSGTESAMAAQTLVGLGYTNIWNLTGGMNAWQASGRILINKNR